MNIESDHFSTRTYYCLKCSNITTFEQLACLSEKQLLKIKNFGRKSLNETKYVLNEIGYTLGTVPTRPLSSAENAVDDAWERNFR